MSKIKICGSCGGEVSICDSCGNDLEEGFDVAYCVVNAGHYCKDCVHDAFINGDEE